MLTPEEIEVMQTTMFYNYNQNNSGGSFDFDEDKGITLYVIIEAVDDTMANHRAEAIGLYFDGVGDCECCGDRWCPPYEDGTEEPMLYDKPVGDPDLLCYWMRPSKEIAVHRLDGTIEWFGKPE